MVRGRPLETLWGGGGVGLKKKHKKRIRARQKIRKTKFVQGKKNSKKYSCTDESKFIHHVGEEKKLCKTKIPSPHHFPNGRHKIYGPAVTTSINHISICCNVYNSSNNLQSVYIVVVVIAYVVCCCCCGCRCRRRCCCCCSCWAKG